MPGFHRRPLVLFICCAFAGIQSAQAGTDSAPADLPAVNAGEAGVPDAGGAVIAPIVLAANDQALPLRMERKFDILKPKPAEKPPTGLGIPAPPSPPKNKEAHPVFIVADHIEGRTEEVTEAEGNVEVRKFGTLLLADKVAYWPLEDEVDAQGHVHLLQQEDEVSGPHLRMKLSEQIGFFEEADYKVKREVLSRFYRPVTAMTTVVDPTTTTGGAPLMISVPSSYGLQTTGPLRRSTEGYGHAERIDFEGENQIRLSNATYSTCKPDETDWYVRGKEMRLDYDHEEGTTKDASVVFKDVPIFYTPVGFFSLNHQRKSGFLPANFAASSKNGFDLTLPYYWSIAPNYDVTFYPREMSKRGFQLGGEGRYTGYNYTGTTLFEYLPNDQMENRSRYAYSLIHAHNLGQGLSASVNWNGVSDNFYWQDFSSRLLQTSQSQLPRQLALNYAPGSWWTANMQMLRYQTLQFDPSVTRPYFIEPQINFSGRLPDIYKTDLSLFGQYSKFDHPTLVEGSRVVLYPQLTLPIINPAYTIFPKIGLHMTEYGLDRQSAGNPSSISRVLPTFSFDSTLFFERDTKWFGGSDYIQTLEPRLYYVYIPFRNQDNIPAFDTALADFNFSQIFSENRYVGYDRINDANQLTAAVTTRYLDATTGTERFKAMVGQRYYFSQQRVTLKTPTFTEIPRTDNTSNFLAAFNGLVLPKTYVDAAWEYNYHLKQDERYSVGARYQPDLAKVISASYRFNRNASSSGQGPIDQFDIAGQWPITSRWYAVGRYNYSIRDKQMLEGIGGLEYNAGCWAARFVVQRLEALSTSSNTTIFFQLELNDFASVGSSPVQLLRRTVPGYGKVNEMPTTGSLLTTQ